MTRSPHQNALPLAATVLLALTIALVSCEKSPDPAPPTPSRAPTGDVGEERPTSASGIILQKEPGRAALDGSCERDRDCQTPLRCLDSTCVIPPAVDGDVRDSTPRLLVDVGGERPVRIYLEVADGGYERQRGLMWRERMADDWGMLFVSPKARIQSFWMQNTYLPLDMVFIATDGTIVNIAADARPLDTEPRYSSKAAARYVLELNAGAAAEMGIVPGQRVRLVDVPGQHDPMILN